MKTATCSCGASWHATNATSHCAAPGCHQTFTSTSGFDAHRRDDGDGNRVCINPATAVRRNGEPVFTARRDRSGAPVWEHHSAAAARAWFQDAGARTRNTPEIVEGGGDSRPNTRPPVPRTQPAPERQKSRTTR